MKEIEKLKEEVEVLRSEIRQEEENYNNLVSSYKKKHRGTLKFTDEEAEAVHNQYSIISEKFTKVVRLRKEIAKLILNKMSA